MTDQEIPRLYIVEWRRGPGQPWRHPTSNLEGSTFDTMPEAREFAGEADFGESRIVVWKREAIEHVPLPDDVEAASAEIHESCHICRRRIDRPSDEVPLCGPCESTARVAGKQAAEAERFPDPEARRWANA